MTLTWTVDDTQPAITQTITVNSLPVDLSSSTVKFRMRAVGSDVLKVDHAATIVSPATDGKVSYTWNTGDLDTPGPYLCWWVVTTGTDIQSVGEAVINVVGHSTNTAYVDLEAARGTLDLGDFTGANVDLQQASLSVSRAIEQQCNRRFWLDADANQIRFYTPARWDSVAVDDIVTVTEVAVDVNLDGSYAQTWAATDFWATPYNAAADGWPYTGLEVASHGQFVFPTKNRSVRVKGRYGWSAVPEPIVTATMMLASKTLKVMREAPFGVAQFGDIAMRVGRTDPQICALIDPYRRHRFTFG